MVRWKISGWLWLWPQNDGDVTGMMVNVLGNHPIIPEWLQVSVMFRGVNYYRFSQTVWLPCGFMFNACLRGWLHSDIQWLSGNILWCTCRSVSWKNMPYVHLTASLSVEVTFINLPASSFRHESIPVPGRTTITKITNPFSLRKIMQRTRFFYAIDSFWA